MSCNIFLFGLLYLGIFFGSHSQVRRSGIVGYDDIVSCL